MGKTGYTFLAFLSIFIWGISLAFTKTLLLNGFTPNMITFARFAIALIAAQILLKTPQEKTIKKGDHRYFILIGLCGISLFYFFENTGLAFTTVANTSLITATIPLFTLMTARFVFGKKLHWMNVIGIISGLIGTAVLLWKDLIHSSIHLKGDLLVFGSVVTWVIYSFSYKKVMNNYSHQFILKKIFQIGVIFLIPVLIVEHNSISGALKLRRFCNLQNIIFTEF